MHQSGERSEAEVLIEKPISALTVKKMRECDAYELVDEMQRL